jgi:Zn-dependent M28 family amino/carboxypeptidase
MKKSMVAVFCLLAWLAGQGVSASASPAGKDYKAILWGYLKTLDGFGPRFPGTPGYEKTRQLIREVGAKYADQVHEHRFTVSRSGAGEPVIFSNYEMVFQGAEPGQPILIGAHYDTRPYADEESDPALRQRPIPGANDGGSGTAVLLGLARYLHEHKPKRPVTLVFFDGEDFGAKNSGEILLGSVYHASQLAKQDKSTWPMAVIVVDMVGDKSLEIFKETHSQASAAWLVELIHQIARDNGFKQFRDTSKFTVWDDHSPFIDLHIPSALIIDFDYPHWHTLRDTLDKCSPASLHAVFSVVVEALSRIRAPR